MWNFIQNNASFWTFLTALFTLIYTFYTGRMVKKELGPKLYVKGQEVNIKGEYDKGLMIDIGLMEDFKRKGFSEERADIKYIMNIYNNGNFPANDINLKYKIYIYKYINIWENGVIVDTKIVVDKTINRKKKVEYLPPSDSLQIPVMYMDLFRK